MARQPKTSQPKTKFVQRHKVKCHSCGIPTSHFDIKMVDGTPRAICTAHTRTV